MAKKRKPKLYRISADRLLLLFQILDIIDAFEFDGRNPKQAKLVRLAMEKLNIDPDEFESDLYGAEATSAIEVFVRFLEGNARELKSTILDVTDSLYVLFGDWPDLDVLIKSIVKGSITSDTIKLKEMKVPTIGRVGRHRFQY